MSDGIDKRILVGKWLHSHEEDTPDETVFRPATYRLPPSRGRKAFELRADGTMVDLGIGPDDRPSARTGSWNLNESNDLVLRPHDSTARPTVLRIAQAGSDKLVIKRST